MKKSWKFMIGTLLVLFAIYLFINDYTKSLVNMEDKLGIRVGGGELSVRDNSILRAYLELYEKYIAKEEYEKAYNMTGISYREYISYEDYIEKVKSQEIKDMTLENIKAITTSVYDATFDISGEEKHYSILNDDEKMLHIYPDSFLDYAKLDNKASKKKLEIKLEYYVANIDKCILSFNIENRSNKAIEISKSKLAINEHDFAESDEKITLNPKESKKVTLEFETDYSLPKQVILYRSTDKADKFIEYSIDIKR